MRLNGFVAYMLALLMVGGGALHTLPAQAKTKSEKTSVLTAPFKAATPYKPFLPPAATINGLLPQNNLNWVEPSAAPLQAATSAVAKPSSVKTSSTPSKSVTSPPSLTLQADEPSVPATLSSIVLKPATQATGAAAANTTKPVSSSLAGLKLSAPVQRLESRYQVSENGELKPVKATVADEVLASIAQQQGTSSSEATAPTTPLKGGVVATAITNPQQQQVENAASIAAMATHQGMLNYSNQRLQEEELKALWQATVDRNPVIRFSLEKLALPKELHKSHSSQFLNKTLSTLISGAAMASTLAGSGSAYTQLGILAGGQALQNLVTGNTGENAAKTPLTPTEQIQLAGLVDTLKQDLVLAYHTYAHSVKRLEVLNHQTTEANALYSQQLQRSDTSVATLTAASNYYQNAIQEQKLRQTAKLARLNLERLAGSPAVQQLNLGLNTQHLASLQGPLPVSSFALPTPYPSVTTKAVTIAPTATAPTLAVALAVPTIKPPIATTIINKAAFSAIKPTPMVASPSVPQNKATTTAVKPAVKTKGLSLKKQNPNVPQTTLSLNGTPATSGLKPTRRPAATSAASALAVSLITPQPAAYEKISSQPRNTAPVKLPLGFLMDAIPGTQ